MVYPLGLGFRVYGAFWFRVKPGIALASWLGKLWSGVQNHPTTLHYLAFVSGILEMPAIGAVRFNADA